MIDKDTFISSINENDCAYQLFANNHLPTYKEYYVEGEGDDVRFYKYYLAKIHHLPEVVNLYGCQRREDVLRKYKEYTGKRLAL